MYVCIHTGIQEKLTAISEYSMHTRFFGINCLLGKIKANKTYFLVHECRRLGRLSWRPHVVVSARVRNGFQSQKNFTMRMLSGLSNL